VTLYDIRRGGKPSANFPQIACPSETLATEWQKETELNTPNDKSGEFSQNCNNQSRPR
jgi:hypothetical protein